MNPSPKNRRMLCPICSGAGKITEDTSQYEFITRDPLTEKCLVCNGEGFVGPRKKLPDGTEVHQLASKMPVSTGMPVSDRQGSAGVSPAGDTGGCQSAAQHSTLPTPSVSPVPSVVQKNETSRPQTSELLVIIIRGITNHRELCSIIQSTLQPHSQIKGESL